LASLAFFSLSLYVKDFSFLLDHPSSGSHVVAVVFLGIKRCCPFVPFFLPFQQKVTLLEITRMLSIGLPPFPPKEKTPLSNRQVL